ncbi:transposase [Acidocella sp.]|uniref:transposase n=1 Tax=Acidocella sp. TaxID=50710 RepID=UPI00345AF4DE
MPMNGLSPCWQTGIKPSSSRPKQTKKIKRDYDRDIYKARHLIENCFAKLKQFRAIATRYDKTARNFLAGIHLAAAAIWLK